MQSTKSGDSPPAEASCSMRSTTLPLDTPCGLTSTIVWPGTTCSGDRRGPAWAARWAGGGSGPVTGAGFCSLTGSRLAHRGTTGNTRQGCCCTHTPHPRPRAHASGRARSLRRRRRRRPHPRGLHMPSHPPLWARWTAPPPGGPAVPWPARSQSRGRRRGSATPAPSPWPR